jgi:cyclophilin family peptidyl-prolyl cis-trans isomerase
MASRVGIALAIYLGIASAAAAQVVRFETSVGSFDMVLNPTNDLRLDGHVDNMLRYVANGNYNGSWINRADEGFVLQMGGFFSHTLRPPMTIASARPVDTFDPVRGQPMISGLSNTLGTVSLALPSGPGGAIPDAGTSSFFINLRDNSGLDNAFTVFAAVPDMTVVNEIMALMQRDLTADPLFGESPGNLAFIDVPLQDNGFQVFITRAFVVSDAMAVTAATAGVQSIMAQSAASAGGVSSSPQVASAAVPEPTTGGLVIFAAWCLLCFRSARAR